MQHLTRDLMWRTGSHNNHQPRALWPRDCLPALAANRCRIRRFTNLFWVCENTSRKVNKYMTGMIRNFSRGKFVYRWRTSSSCCNVIETGYLSDLSAWSTIVVQTCIHFMDNTPLSLTILQLHLRKKRLSFAILCTSSGFSSSLRKVLFHNAVLLEATTTMSLVFV
jgi:hypothetical protein